ncbi:LOW QUALITY PROTEIN: hypothetical protein V2J09_003396 [Rumex salicifolius]
MLHALNSGGSCPDHVGESLIRLSFIERVKKIAELRRMCAEKGVNPWIEVDGGVTLQMPTRPEPMLWLLDLLFLELKIMLQLYRGSKPAKDLKLLLLQILVHAFVSPCVARGSPLVL